MTKRNSVQQIFLYLILIGNCYRLAEGDSQAVNSIRPRQLEGLRSVIYFADIDADVQNSIELGDKIKSIVAKRLLEAGIAISNKADSVLWTGVGSYPIEVEELSEYVLIEVFTELRESVRLLRKPSQRRAATGITWSKRCIDVIPRKDIGSYSLKIAESQLDSFVGNLKIVNDIK